MILAKLHFRTIGNQCPNNTKVKFALSELKRTIQIEVLGISLATRRLLYHGHRMLAWVDSNELFVYASSYKHLTLPPSVFVACVLLFSLLFINLSSVENDILRNERAEGWKREDKTFVLRLLTASGIFSNIGSDTFRSVFKSHFL